jgi:hypothetical protein
MTEKLEGPHGTAEAVPVPDVPQAAETVCTWLLTAPLAHPLWSQYLLCVVRLRDGIPGFPPPKRDFDGATHELIVVALNPEHGPQTAARMAGYFRAGGLPYLTPHNIVHQVEATDEEAARLAEMSALAVVNGWLTPETADAPERIRADWKASLVKTLAHDRGEAHAP